MILICQRSYGALAEKTAAAAAAAVGAIRKVADEEEEEEEKKVHFDKVDVAELREKFLSKKKGQL
ncbi:hypothetical protein ACJRO7_035685 [Eucalyptus globulus]|uniref:Uncharacterized protein n=1 Tax=Eucalyptus globulus TaxID=34317 RepID=A0ABD3J9I3_EUCGL